MGLIFGAIRLQQGSREAGAKANRGEANDASVAVAAASLIIEMQLRNGMNLGLIAFF